MNTLAYNAGDTAQFFETAVKTANYIDKRFVRGLMRIGTTPDGFAMYSYMPLWSFKRREAVLSQDVQKRYPEQVVTGMLGKLRVTDSMRHFV